MRVTFLGTGTSIGVPVIGCDCAVCQSTDTRNKRLRSSIYIETEACCWVVDTGPDFRAQCLRENIRRVDAVIYTHSHMDHVVGFDDLRRFTFGDIDLPIHATASCMDDLRRMFGYAFSGENRYTGYIKPAPHEIEGPFVLGECVVTPLPVQHGKVETIGFHFQMPGGRRFGYVSDCKILMPETIRVLEGVDVLVLDALRFTPHPTHMNFEEALAMREQLGAGETWFTHFSDEVDHEKAEAALPKGVALAYDGLKLEI